MNRLSFAVAVAILSCVPVSAQVKGCKGITEDVDKFTGKVTYRSPLLEPISFTMIKDQNGTTTYLQLRCSGSTLNVNQTGATVILADSTMLKWPRVKVEPTATQYGWVYSAFISLSERDIAALANSPIRDFRLYIYDATIKKGEKYQDYLNCLMAK